MPQYASFDDPRLADVSRQRRMAEMLRQQSAEPFEQQTAGGYVVPVSPTAGLAKMLRAYSAGQYDRQAGEAEKAVYDSRGKALSEALRGGPPELIRSPDYVEPSIGERLQASGDPYWQQQSVPIILDERQRAQEAEQARALAEYKIQQEAAQNAAQNAFTAGENAADRAARIEAARIREEGGGASGAPYVVPFPTAEYGMLAMDARDPNGTVIVPGVGRVPMAQLHSVMAGQGDTAPQLTRPGDNPGLQGEIAGERTEAQKAAELEASLRAELPAAQARLRAVDKKVQDLGAIIDRAVAGTNRFMASGAGAGIAAAVGGSGARDLASDLTTIKANLGFAELQAMRDASPTGGALGQVAVQELEALQSTIASLDQTQSDEQLRANLDKVRQHLTRWQLATRQAHQEKYNAAPAAPANSPSGIKFLGFE